MGFLRLARAVADASGDGAVDWTAAGHGAKAATHPGSIRLGAEERAAYAADLRVARARIRSVTGVAVTLPVTVEVHHRHHWIDAAVPTFERVLAPLQTEAGGVPAVARTVNTGTMAVALSMLARNVLGQYDPLLLGGDGSSTDGGVGEHALYFVHPNIVRVADALAVDRPRFRRWIAFHEVAHAAEFAAAPWLGPHLEERMERAVTDLAAGHLDRTAVRQLDAAMTAVEGFAELVMDRAFDAAAGDLRAELAASRRNRGPLARLLRRLLGFGMKRRQYERGKAFFDHVARARGVRAATAVWHRPAHLPSADELAAPDRWLARVDP